MIYNFFLGGGGLGENFGQNSLLEWRIKIVLEMNIPGLSRGIVPQFSSNVPNAFQKWHSCETRQDKLGPLFNYKGMR